jgi:hypothetical protein
MQTGRWDVWVYHETADLVVTSAALGQPERPFLKQDNTAWKKAIHRGEILAVRLMQPGPVVVRVLLNGALTPEEDAAWVDRWETTLKLPAGGLLLSGDPDTVFGIGYPEFETRLPDVPAGDYLAHVFTLLPGENGKRSLTRAAPERLGAYFRRTRPGEPFPAWLARMCAETPKLDPGHEQEWRGKSVADDPAEYVSFLLHLSPLAAPPLRLRMKDGAPPVPLNPRLPDVCPLGLVASDVGRPSTPIRGPIKLSHRIPVADRLAGHTLTPVTGGPVVVPVRGFTSLYRVAAFCYRGTYPELRVEVPAGVTFAPDWPNASVGVRAEPVPGGWRVVFAAMNWEHVHALPHAAPALATAPDGVVLELMTADPSTADTKGQPGWQRYRGPIRAGRWHVSEAYPATDRQSLQDAVALVNEYLRGPSFTLLGKEEAAAVRRLAEIDSMLRDALREKKLVFDGLTTRLPEDESFLRELLAMKVFRVRFGSRWPVYSDDSADETWNNLMDKLEAFRLSRTPPEGTLILEGVRGKFFHTQGKPADAEDRARWDAELAALGFVALGQMTAERVRELTLLGYVLPDSPIYAVVCLGGLAPRSALDYYTTFANGSSQTTTTNLFADGDAPRWGIFKKAFPRASPAELLDKHRERMPKLVKKHGEPRPATPTLEALASAIDEYFVRWDA